MALAAAGLVITAPALILLAIAIKLSSRGPIFYRQQRIGRHGRPFIMLKLRTMVADADRMVEGMLHTHGADERFYKFRDDARVTALGRWLRRWSIDELPQLWNVIRGEMSCVGPRPALASEIAAYEARHLRRLDVRPGITGPWQISGRSELGFEDCVRLDMAYIDGWSLMRDLTILARTIPAVLRRDGAW